MLLPSLQQLGLWKGVSGGPGLEWMGHGRWALVAGLGASLSLRRLKTQPTTQ